MSIKLRQQAAVICGKRNQITHVKVGDIIEEKRRERDREWIYVERTLTYRVIAIYPYHVLGEEVETGLLRSFCLGDLIILGLERQSDELEVLRRC